MSPKEQLLQQVRKSTQRNENFEAFSELTFFDSAEQRRFLSLDKFLSLFSNYLCENGSNFFYTQVKRNLIYSQKVQNIRAVNCSQSCLLG